MNSHTSRHWSIFSACTVLIIGVSGDVRGDEKKADVRSNLTGQYVVVACTGTPNRQFILTGATVKSLGERKFISGTLVYCDGKDGDGSVKTWIAIDEVRELSEFGELAAARSHVRTAIHVEKPSNASSGDVMEWEGRSMKIPIDCYPGRKEEIAKLRLFVSNDLGRSWKKAAEADADQAAFTYTAPEDGEFWFTLQIESKDGRNDPSDVSQAKPGLKVRFASAGGRAPESKDLPLIIPPARR